MNGARFPMTLAAAQKIENAGLWRLADALLIETGIPGKHGINDGSRDKLREAAEELAAHGYEYDLDTLRKIRRTASRFPEGRRRPSVGFWVHAEAGDPETLAEIFKWANGRRLTVVLVREWKALREPVTTAASNALHRDIAEIEIASLVEGSKRNAQEARKLLDGKAPLPPSARRRLQQNGLEAVQAWAVFADAVAKPQLRLVESDQRHESEDKNSTSTE